MRRGPRKRFICKRNEHDMTDEKNVWVRPSDGKRYCRACMAVTRAVRRAYKMIATQDAKFIAEENEDAILYNAVTGERMTYVELFWDEK